MAVGASVERHRPASYLPTAFTIGAQRPRKPGPEGNIFHLVFTWLRQKLARVQHSMCDVQHGEHHAIQSPLVVNRMRCCRTCALNNVTPIFQSAGVQGSFTCLLNISTVAATAVAVVVVVVVHMQCNHSTRTKCTGQIYCPL